jgi:nucleotide-binding universal stress UspA family protein
MHQKILVPTDGSDESMSAVDEALDIASVYGATIHALYIVDETTRGRGLVGIDRSSPFTTLRRIGGDATDEIKARVEKEGVEVTTAIREGIPHRAIIEYADENDIDLIVISSHGRSGVRRFIFGSVTERVVRSTERPVVVVQCQPSTTNDVDADTTPRRPRPSN